MTNSLKKFIPFILAICLHLIFLIPLLFQKSQLESDIRTQINQSLYHSINFNLKKQINHRQASDDEFKNNPKIKTQLEKNVQSVKLSEDVSKVNNDLVKSTSSQLNLDSMTNEQISNHFNFIEYPNYPQMARLKNLEGKVKVRIIFSEGNVKNVELLQSSQYSILDQAVIESVKKWSLKTKENFEVNKTFNFKLR